MDNSASIPEFFAENSPHLLIFLSTSADPSMPRPCYASPKWPHKWAKAFGEEVIGEALGFGQDRGFVELSHHAPGGCPAQR